MLLAFLPTKLIHAMWQKFKTGQQDMNLKEEVYSAIHSPLIFMYYFRNFPEITKHSLKSVELME
jgi:hypothetical protein